MSEFGHRMFSTANVGPTRVRAVKELDEIYWKILQRITTMACLEAAELLVKSAAS